MRRKRFSSASGIPVCSIVSKPADWSSKRITTDSPYCTGIVDIRTSIVRPLIFIWNRPSCGSRFSEISKLAINFSRSTSAGLSATIAGWVAATYLGSSRASSIANYSKQSMLQDLATSLSFPLQVVLLTTWESLLMNSAGLDRNPQRVLHM